MGPRSRVIVSDQQIALTVPSAWMATKKNIAPALVIVIDQSDDGTSVRVDEDLIVPELDALNDGLLKLRFNFACASDVSLEVVKFIKHLLNHQYSQAEAAYFLQNLSDLESENTVTSPMIAKNYDRKLTIGMATHDDYDGVYFSLQSIRLHHPEVLDRTEFIIVDNNPAGVCSSHLRHLTELIDHVQYIPYASKNGTSVRNVFFDEARTDYVLSIDCHVLIQSGAINRLLHYFDENPHTKDFLQGPIMMDDLKNLYTHYEPTWVKGNYGHWGRDERGDDVNAPPFDIPMQGAGLFACRRDAWQGFNPLFRGFGADEGYLHEKMRQAGGRTLCLPFLRWLHRFGRPNGVNYPLDWPNKIRNYLIGFHELGLDLNQVKDHFCDYIGKENATKIISDIEAELLHTHGVDIR